MEKNQFARKDIYKMSNALFNEYKRIRDEIAILEDMKAELELQLFDEFDMFPEAKNNHIANGYRFVRMSRKSWEYSATVASMQTELSKRKKLEEVDGTAALKKESQYIRVVKEETE
jgi:hypothetical protein